MVDRCGELVESFTPPLDWLPRFFPGFWLAWPTVGDCFSYRSVGILPQQLGIITASFMRMRLCNYSCSSHDMLSGFYTAKSLLSSNARGHGRKRVPA
jgi:hypothetical protein